MRGGHAEAQSRANRATAPFAHRGAFNVFRVDPTSAAWTHEQLLEIVHERMPQLGKNRGGI